MKTLQMKTIRLSIKNYVRHDLGLRKGQGLIPNCQSLTKYLHEQVVLKTREHSLNQTLEKISFIHYNFTQFIA